MLLSRKQWFASTILHWLFWLRKDRKWARNERYIIEESSSEYEESYIIEESSSEYESESDSMNGMEDSDSDTEFDVNDSSYNVAVQPVDQAPDLSDADIIPWSKVMEGENGHFEVDFDTTTSGTKHINSCNKPIDFFYLLYSKQLWNLVVTNTNKYARDQNLSHWEDVNFKTMKGFMAIIFNMGLIKKNEINDYWSARNCMNTP